MLENNISELAEVITHTCQCAPVHLDTALISLRHKGRVVWEGTVEVFRVAHPRTNRCYAWAYQDDEGSSRYVAVLALPPVDSARAAVKAFIISQTQGA